MPSTQGLSDCLPRRAMIASPKQVLVIGAGVSGLTTALSLARAGFRVKVVAEELAPLVTSVVAGALWEWPPAVCGQHHNPSSLERSKQWCKTSYDVFAKLSVMSNTGVYLRPVNFYFKFPVEIDERQRTKMNELRRHVRQFRHDVALTHENEINPQLGLRDAYSHLAPMVDTDVYMSWLLKRVLDAGCQIIRRKITGCLRDQQNSLRREYGADIIVNCTGLGARQLGDPSVYPLRGALVRVRTDQPGGRRLTQAHCVSHDGSSQDRGFVFIVPRGENLAVIGGLAEPHEWDLEIGMHNYDPVRKMYERCINFLPWLSSLEIDESEPVRVGLRPFRDGSVRLEHEVGTRLVHNYGHGGSGVTFSWGCAGEVTKLVERMLVGVRAEN